MHTTQKKRRPNRSKFNRNNNRPNHRNRNNRSKKRRSTSINPSFLINKDVQVKAEKKVDLRSFDQLDLDNRLLSNLKKKGFHTMTEIQDRSIEAQISGENLLGIANTGTGKTGAFMIPILQRLLQSDHSFQTMILVPTRELALQVEQECRSMTKGLGIFCLSLIGGTSIRKDIERLRRKNQIIVGTPGRVNDLMNRRVLNVRHFNTLVLDEFDRMLDMGFIHDVQRVADEMSNRKQTILFSATENKKQRPIISQFLHNPYEVRVSSGQTTADQIHQDIVKVEKGENKINLLIELLSDTEFEKVLIFDETKRGVSKIAKNLHKLGIPVDEIHGDKSQAYRKKALDKFKSGKARVLVATDVAARGIDVNDVSHVINYQIPQDMESYIHRIGRTGRAGKTGKALTLVNA